MSSDSPYHHLYTSTRWLRMRAYQLLIEPLCRFCKARGKIKLANTADHVVPHKGDPELFYNGELQSLCPSCHSSDKKAEESGSLHRGCGVDGVPIANNHPWNVQMRNHAALAPAPPEGRSVTGSTPKPDPDITKPRYAPSA